MSRHLFICLIAASLVALGTPVNAQQTDAPNFLQTYAGAVSNAEKECKALWADRTFDSLRKKIPLGEDKPTFEMLKSGEKLKSKEKPTAELAIKALEKCRSAWGAAYAMLPEPISAMIKGVERQQDAIIAELYRGKITFGDFNAAFNRLNGHLSAALSGVQLPDQGAPAATSNTARSPAALPSAPEQRDAVAPVQSSETRLALVIGNSGYANLPKLSNPTNDAHAIADVLKALGYRTRLVFDASEQTARREIRQFASESEKAEVALVFYAGHGAQVNGSNYLLPVDIDIPRTEADIQFSGLKVDDLINSIRSNTKIVFLDACRDNPVLFKNIVRGRGSSPMGLAPAATSNFEQRAGGGVFIAYATDAGSVADDGQGKHSPFTQALLRNLKKPISIDDMFSLVTREVRLVTKNSQRPYKYASLENIICVAPRCSSSIASTMTDITLQAQQSQSDELQIALQTNNVDALEAYLEKYPETSKRTEILDAIAKLRRAEFVEWTLFDIGNLRTPHFIKLNSIQQFGDRVAVRSKYLADPLAPKEWLGKPFPEAEYVEQVTVYVCGSPSSAIAELEIFNKSGELLYHYKWADPQFLNLSIGAPVNKGSIAYSARNILCHEELKTPLVSKKRIAEMRFSSLSSTVTGDGEIFYRKNGPGSENQKEMIIGIKYSADRNVKIFFAPGTSIPNPPDYRIEVSRLSIKCDERKVAISKTEYFNASNQLVYMTGIDLSAGLGFTDIQGEYSPFASLHKIVCQKPYAGIGIRFATSDGAIKVEEVFEGTAAARAGVQPNDIISHINGEPVNGLASDVVTEKIRGPANSKIDLKLVRKGHDGPIELSMTREVVQRGQASK